MSKFIAFYLLALILFLVSCSEKYREVTTNLSLSKHAISGKWKSSPLRDRESIYLTFQETDKLLKVELVSDDENPKYYGYEIIDENTIDFLYEKSQKQEQYSIRAKVKDDGTLELKCRQTDNPKVTGFESPPILCFKFDFKKIQ